MNSPPGGRKKGSGLWGKNGRETRAYKRSGRWILEKQFHLLQIIPKIQFEFLLVI